jgi:hypothetical protein
MNAAGSKYEHLLSVRARRKCVTNGNPEYLSPGYLMGFESALIFVSTCMFFSK